MFDSYESVRILKPFNDSCSEIRLIQDIETEKYYILKIIKGINTPLYKVIFEREVQALTTLRKCENIVRLIDYTILDFESFGQCGLIFLENIEGQTLEELNVTELKNLDRYRIIEQLLNAIQVAHENNIIHRDINPRNIMIYGENKVKLIDFGISKIKDMINKETVFQFATNKYAAPEINIHRENANEKSDIYSLGAVIYYIFTGEEPPIANEFEERLLTSGIDIELREIVKKMISINLEERINSIFNVKKLILSFLRRRIQADKKYMIYINSRILEHMKNVSLASDYKNYAQIIDYDLREDFLDSYAWVEENEKNENVYYFYGNCFEIECFYDNEKQMYYVTKIKKLYPSKRERIKEKKLKINGEIQFINRRSDSANNNFELTKELEDYKLEFESDTNINNEYLKKYSVWHKLLEIMKDTCQNGCLKIKYNSFEILDDYCIFHITESNYYDIDERDNEEITFIYEKNVGKKTKIKEIGVFYKIENIENKFKLWLKITDRSNLKQLPKKGDISEDYRKNLILIDRQINAINTFNNEEYVSTANLKGIFSEVSKPEQFNNPNDIKSFNKMLDISQQKAVRKALSSKDITLIQGPPGTGKTNVIIEILRQIMSVNDKGGVFKQKILLVSQSHTAVDNMLEDLNEVDADNSQIIRIGKVKNLSEIVKNKYAIDYVQEKWKDQIIKRSENSKLKILKYLNINESAFCEYYDAKRLVDTIKVDEIVNVEKIRLAKIIENFEKQNSDILNKAEFKGLIIQQDWINRIKGDMFIQRYFVRNSVVIAGTCTGFISNNIIGDMTFDYLIIDEAAKATFTELLISMVKAKKIIMVGDHKQLPPILDNDLIKSKKSEFNDNNLDFNTLYESIFLKLYNYLPDKNRDILNTQYRMHPVIGTMISRLFYENEISNGVSEKDREHNIEEYKDLAIVWVDTSECDKRYEEKMNNTYRNKLEAHIVKEQLKLINRCAKNEKMDVGVITPYSGQKLLIRNEIKNSDFDSISNKVAVNSVDAFQGGQKDIIIYSTVRSSKEHTKIGFLKSEERLNVAFSRAKKLLIIVGDKEFLDNDCINGNRFPEVIKYIKDNGKNCKILKYNNI
jgi:Superfamily I DNA and RNA helicases and helicase subunits